MPSLEQRIELSDAHNEEPVTKVTEEQRFANKRARKERRRLEKRRLEEEMKEGEESQESLAVDVTPVTPTKRQKVVMMTPSATPTKDMKTLHFVTPLKPVPAPHFSLLTPPKREPTVSEFVDRWRLNRFGPSIRMFDESRGAEVPLHYKSWPYERNTYEGSIPAKVVISSARWENLFLFKNVKLDAKKMRDIIDNLMKPYADGPLYSTMVVDEYIRLEKLSSSGQFVAPKEEQLVQDSERYKEYHTMMKKMKHTYAGCRMCLRSIKEDRYCLGCPMNRDRGSVHVKPGTCFRLAYDCEGGTLLFFNRIVCSLLMDDFESRGCYLPYNESSTEWIEEFLNKWRLDESYMDRLMKRLENSTFDLWCVCP